MINPEDLVKFLFQRIRTHTQELNESEARVAQRRREIEEQKREMESLQERLQAEQTLRIQAEKESSLIQLELEQLQRKLRKHNNETTQLQQKLKETQIEHELRKASTSPDQAQSAQKIQELVDTLRKDHQTSKAELKQLRETNRALLQNSAHAQTQREQLINQIAELKKKIKERKLIAYQLGLEIRSEQELYGFNAFGSTYRDEVFGRENNNPSNVLKELEDDIEIQLSTSTKTDDDDVAEEESERFIQLIESDRKK